MTYPNRTTAERVMEQWIEETLKRDREQLIERIKKQLRRNDTNLWLDDMIPQDKVFIIDKKALQKLFEEEEES